MSERRHATEPARTEALPYTRHYCPIMQLTKELKRPIGDVIFEVVGLMREVRGVSHNPAECCNSLTPVCCL